MAAWGEEEDEHGQRDRSLSRPGHHRPAMPRILGGKSAELTTDTDSDGLPSPGDVLRFILKMENRGSGSASGLNLQDTVPANTTYVANSTAVSFNGAAATPTWTVS